jgi:hypothetical protein
MDTQTKRPEWVERLIRFNLAKDEVYPPELIEQMPIRQFWSYLKARLQRTPEVKRFISKHGLDHPYWAAMTVDQCLIIMSEPKDFGRKTSSEFRPDDTWVNSGSISPVTVLNWHYYKGIKNQKELFFHCSEWFKEEPVALNADDYIAEEEKQEIEKKKQQEIEKEKAEIEDALKGIVDFEEN